MLTVMSEPPLLLALDLAGTFAFALNGAVTAVEEAKLDIVGILTLGMVTALGGGILRDILSRVCPADQDRAGIALRLRRLADTPAGGRRAAHDHPSLVRPAGFSAASSCPWLPPPRHR